MIIINNDDVKTENEVTKSEAKSNEDRKREQLHETKQVFV